MSVDGECSVAAVIIRAMRPAVDSQFTDMGRRKAARGGPGGFAAAVAIRGQRAQVDGQD